MNILIVDDNKTFLEAAGLFIETKLGYNVIKAYTSPIELINSFESHSEVDCILIDIEMPRLNGIETVKRLLKDFNYIKFIAITNHTERAYLLDLVCAGFKGCVFKNSLFEELPNAIPKVVGGGYFFPESINI